MNGNQYFKTACGGYATSILLSLCAAFFIIQFSGFVNMSNVNVVLFQEFDAQPLELDTNTKNFMFAVSIKQTNTAFNLNPFFTIQMTNYNQTRFDNGTVVKSTQLGNLVPCTLEHWNLGGTFNWTRSFNSLQLNQWLCPSLNSTLLLQGAFDSTFFDYVRFSVVACNPKQNPNCANDSQRAAYLQANGAFSLQFYTSNYIVNTDKVVPDDTYLLSSLYWDFIPNITYVESNVFMQEYQVTTDMSIMPWTQQEVQKLPVIDQREVQNFVYSSNQTGGIYAKIFLRRSYFTQIYTRKFQKLQDLLSIVGGFVQSLILLCGIFLAMYNQKKLMVYLANRLYDFEFDEEKDKQEREHLESELQKIREQYEANLKKKNGEQKSNGQGQEKKINMDHRDNSSGEQQNSAVVYTQQDKKPPTKASVFKKDAVNDQKVQREDLREKQEIELPQYNKRIVEEDNPNKNKPKQQKSKNPKCQSAVQSNYVVEEEQSKSVNKSKGQGDQEQEQEIQENGSQKDQNQQLMDRQRFLRHQLEHIILRQRKHLDLNFKYLVYTVTCGKFYRTKLNLMIDKSTTRVEAQLDLCTILDKLQHIDKMQQLLLNKEQLVLFNFCPKEVFRLEDEKKVIGRDRLKSMFIKDLINFKNANAKKKTKVMPLDKIDPAWMNESSKDGIQISSQASEVNKEEEFIEEENDIEYQRLQDEKAMQFFMHLYDAYEIITQKLTEKQHSQNYLSSSSSSQNNLKNLSPQELVIQNQQQNLPQYLKQVVQKDINERLMSLLGEEMNGIMSTAQLLKDHSDTRDSFLQEKQILGINGQKPLGQNCKDTLSADQKSSYSQNTQMSEVSSQLDSLDRKISNIHIEQLPIELHQELLQNKSRKI